MALNSFLFNLAILLCSIGIRLVSADFIIGGSPAAHGEYPFMALLLKNGQFQCGGSLINGAHVLTAKHCVKYGSAGDYTIRLGEHRRNAKDGTERTVAVKAIRKHPDSDVDIAVLALSETIPESIYIKYLDLGDTEPPAGHPLTAIGWGWTKHSTSSSSNILNELNLPMQTDQACINDGLGWIKQTYQLCAGYISGYYVNVCHGDSGSPLLFRETLNSDWKQVGVVHGGHGGCSSQYHMAIFVSVPSVRQWITENSCFHGDVQVQTPAGHKTMSELQTGDLVLSATPSGELKYSEVIMMMDSRPDLQAEFLEVHTDDTARPLTLTPQHLIFRSAVSNSPNFASSETIMAKRLRVGDSVYRATPDGLTRAVNVTDVRAVSLRGVYAPLTAEGSIVADGTVASSYAYLESQRVAHAAFAPVRWIKAGMELMWGSGNGGSDASGSWYPNLLNSVFGSVLFSS